MASGGAWLKRELDFSQSTANNFMRIFREYGAAQQSLFGGEAKSQSLANLTYTKALRLLAIPDEEERERFIAGHDVEGMSSRELDKALKEREEALKKAAAAEEETRKLRQEAGRLQEELEDQAQVYEAKLDSARAEAGQIRKALDWKEADVKQKQDLIDRQTHTANRLQHDLSKAEAAAQDARDECARLARELEDLKSKPVDVAVEVDKEAVEAARMAAIAEMEEKVDKANEAAKEAKAVRKDAEAALAAAQKELEALKAKGPELRELTQEEKDALTAEAVERAREEDAGRIQGLEKKLAAADPNVAELMVRFTSWQEEYQKLMEILGRIDQDDAERAARLRQGVKTALEQMELQVLALSAPTVKRNMEDALEQMKG